jgi:Na+/proline symporter
MIIVIAGAFFGPLFGLFLLGTLVPRANAAGARIGLGAGLLSLAIIFPTSLSPWWYGAFTCIPTFVMGLLASYFFPPPAVEQVDGLIVVPWRTPEAATPKVGVT